MISPHPYLPRFLTSRIHELFGHFPVVVVSGARQVGKSTLLEHAFPDIPRVVLDPLIDVENARRDPDLFLANRRAPLILDEIQYAPELVPAIKRLLEKDRGPGQYLLTGSQQWGVMKLLAESLAGRAVFLELDSFSEGEIAQSRPEQSWLKEWLENFFQFSEKELKPLDTKNSLFEQLWRGFLPEAQFLPLQYIPDFHKAYQNTYIERDIRQLADLSDLQLFSRFFRLCAALTAQEINHSKLGRELGITPQTGSRWLDLLKATFQWIEIPPYSGNTIKRISGKPKGYLSDTGMICWAQAISSPQAIPNHPLWGSLFETAVVHEIRKQCQTMATPPHLYHWRSHGGAEVDLLLEWNGVFYPIEIKAKSHPTLTDASGIKAFRNTYPHLSMAHGLVIAPCPTYFPLDEKTFALPWDGEIQT